MHAHVSFVMDDVKWIESFTRGLICLLGIFGNVWLAIRSMSGRKTRMRTNDALLLNLALSNLVTSCLVDLPDTIANFANSWFLGWFYCRFFRFCADLSKTNSILCTLLISLFWHQKLVGSLQRGSAPVQLDNLRFVVTLQAAGWIVAAIFSIPHWFYISVSNINGSLFDCVDQFPSHKIKENYEITYLTLANGVPITGIVFASVQIAITLLEHQKRLTGMKSVVQNGVKLQPDMEAGAAALRPTAAMQVRAAKSIVAVASVFLTCWLSHLLLRICNNVDDSDELLIEIANYVGSSYISIIPYIFLYGIRKPFKKTYPA